MKGRWSPIGRACSDWTSQRRNAVTTGLICAPALTSKRRAPPHTSSCLLLTPPMPKALRALRAFVSPLLLLRLPLQRLQAQPRTWRPLVMLPYRSHPHGHSPLRADSSSVTSVMLLHQVSLRNWLTSFITSESLMRPMLIPMVTSASNASRPSLRLPALVCAGSSMRSADA